jgi:hypothetical protein
MLCNLLALIFIYYTFKFIVVNQLESTNSTAYHALCMLRKIMHKDVTVHYGTCMCHVLHKACLQMFQI